MLKEKTLNTMETEKPKMDERIMGSFSEIERTNYVVIVAVGCISRKNRMKQNFVYRWITFKDKSLRLSSWKFSLEIKETIVIIAEGEHMERSKEMENGIENYLKNKNTPFAKIYEK